MRIAILAGALALGLSLPAFAADPAEGLWQTRPDDNGHIGHIEIAPCGAKLCGTLVRAFDSAGKPVKSPNLGKRIVWDMEAVGPGKYGRGKVWAPDRNKTYSSRMDLNGDRLAVSGCVMGICRDGGTWRRVR